MSRKFVKNIEDALEIAKSANAAKSSSLSNMSHDIRTPMNVIVGLSNLMEHELDNPQKNAGVYPEDPDFQ